MSHEKKRPTPAFASSTRLSAIVATGLCLLLLLTGCASPRASLRDPHLLRDCEVVRLPGPTWNHVAEMAVRQRASIEECNRRWEYLRKTNK